MNKKNTKSSLKPKTAREAATTAIAHIVEKFPNLPVQTFDTANLIEIDAKLATAIYRTTLQRWLTLEYLLNIFLNKPLKKLEPSMQGVLLTGAAQLFFMQKLPDYAVVDEMTSLAKKLIRPGAGAMVNAVLRKTASLTKSIEQTAWNPAPNKLPLISEHFAQNSATLTLNENILPDTQNPAIYLSIATSHSKYLIKKWIEEFGREKTIAICLHNLCTPPTIVATENDFKTPNQELYEFHKEAGFILWKANHTQLIDFLNNNPQRRVQDPASTVAVKSTAQKLIKNPRNILDLCAGQGTKTKQLAQAFPKSQITATDSDANRFKELEKIAKTNQNIKAVSLDTLDKTGSKFDLILLDVPCSNSGVLSRRPEAKYRFNNKNLSSLINLQREISAKAIQMLSPDGVIIYSTCSLEKEENTNQAKWIASKIKGKIISENQQLPGGFGSGFHNGSFHALIGQ